VFMSPDQKRSMQRIVFDRILTPNFKVGVEELRSYDMDIRKVLAETPLFPTIRGELREMLIEESE